MVWNFVVDGIMSAWFPCKINCIYVVKFDFLYQLSWWQNEKFPNLQRNMQITRTLVTCINAITCRNKNMQIRAYIYFECQTFSHDTHDKKNIHGFFPKKSTWLDGEFGDIFWGDRWPRYLTLVIADHRSVILRECVMHAPSITVSRPTYPRHSICLSSERAVCGDCLSRILTIIQHISRRNYFSLSTVSVAQFTISDLRGPAHFEHSSFRNDWISNIKHLLKNYGRSVACWHPKNIYLYALTKFTEAFFPGETIKGKLC